MKNKHRSDLLVRPMNHPDPNAPLPRSASTLDAFSHAPLALDEVLARLHQFEDPLAVVDEDGRVVEANGPWMKRAGSELWCAVGQDLRSACDLAAEAGDPLAERLCRELTGVLQGRTEFCEWGGPGEDRVRLARLVGVSGNYALAAFDKVVA